MAAAASHRHSDATITRVTKEGRMLTYCLTVIQQPERARACGSGAKCKRPEFIPSSERSPQVANSSKASADRRPVDPPPVVELRIFEGEGAKEEDITFSYNANFFLFATLETARPMAHGRVQPSPPQIPVLTGMPVSGMAYLDRPTEAGYFIFPDLSVRHEGKYYLSFNLYEETKDGKDADAEPSTDPSKPKLAGVPGSPNSSFDWRLEVKSAPFTVFSAKKFPGLAESTPLSRTVAEQGCRVRIRRDVRMRRRDKATSEYDENMNEEGYARIGRPAEPAHEPYGERSIITGANDERYLQRRVSGEYQQQPYHPHSNTPSPTTPNAPLNKSFLGFGENQGSQYQAPQPQFAQPPPPPAAPAPQSYQPAPPGYPPAPPSQYRSGPPPPPSTNYSYDGQYSQPAYPSNPPRDQRPTFEPETYRRASGATYALPNALQASAYPPAEPSYNRPTSHGYSRPQSPPLPSPRVSLPPIRMQIGPKLDTLNSPTGPLSSVRTIAPPLPSLGFDRPEERPLPYNQYTGPAPSAELTRHTKRPFDAVFASNSQQPLYNGMRPSSAHHNSGAFKDEDELAIEEMKMSYKRADGSARTRDLPAT
ncbi:uncharacterized protein BP5553_02580 [Venustampulla echinocandica]|uniref:Velvet domain-containing protein n=1 Tax=Venustampulla echinocandica TaxID=2656787 RepID=A0A370TRT6_9HELO|nr:uncharacterized protein BP5553_02580 [Venustampulla echinocandica]RDL38240.1 hypothetical protein BP5553_02580 [Venustampulla echinocandica]